MSAQPAPPRLLVADIGGTNTRLALTRGTELIKDSVARYRNADFSALGGVLSAYLETQNNPPCDGACIAVAGPVQDGIGRLTNRDWVIDAETLAHSTGARNVAILNDLQAQGYALGRLQDGTLTTILAAPERKSGAAQLVIGVGTGFNAAPVHETQAGRVVVASECGHMTLPVRSDAERRLARHLETRHPGFTAVEDVLSGRGLERVCHWISSEQGMSDNRNAPTIMQDAAKGEARANAAVRLCCGLLGTIAGDLALVHLPFGGLYLVGGVARAFAPYLESHGFSAAFKAKGRFSDFMDAFSVQVVFDDYAALTGCASYLLRQVKNI